MTSANVHQAKTNLSKLLNAAASGEEVIITRRGGTVTRFALQPLPAVAAVPLFGALKGEIHYADDYDAADSEIQALFDEHLNQSR